MDIKWLKRLKNNKLKKARQIKCETDYGNIEYKWRICNANNSERIERLITQIKFRFNEGNGRAIYNLGYTDKGTPKGITYSTLYDNLKLFHSTRACLPELRIPTCA